MMSAPLGRSSSGASLGPPSRRLVTHMYTKESWYDYHGMIASAFMQTIFHRLRRDFCEPSMIKRECRQKYLAMVIWAPQIERPANQTKQTGIYRRLSSANCLVKAIRPFRAGRSELSRTSGVKVTPPLSRTAGNSMVLIGFDEYTCPASRGKCWKFRTIN